MCFYPDAEIKYRYEHVHERGSLDGCRVVVICAICL